MPDPTEETPADLATAVLDAVETIKRTGGAVEIHGVRIEPCNDRGETATARMLENATRWRRAFARALGIPEDVTPAEMVKAIQGLRERVGTMEAAAARSAMDRFPGVRLSDLEAVHGVRRPTGTHPLGKAAPDVPPGVPIFFTGGEPGHVSPPGEGANRSDVPHSGEPSPRERLSTWLALVHQMEAKLVATLENARAAREMPLPGVFTPETYLATEWAASQLLEALLGLPTPEIPRDDAAGQDPLPWDGE